MFSFLPLVGPDAGPEEPLRLVERVDPFAGQKLTGNILPIEAIPALGTGAHVAQGLKLTGRGDGHGQR